jgi:hypothetical protein
MSQSVVDFPRKLAGSADLHAHVAVRHRQRSRADRVVLVVGMYLKALPQTPLCALCRAKWRASVI